MTERYGEEMPGYRSLPARDGRTRARVECPACGHINFFFMWSWAGNGACRCKGCHVKLRYATGQTIAESKR